MKKTKFTTLLITLFLVLSFYNCEESGEIQFDVIDDFETTATVTGLQGTSQISINETMNVSDLLDLGSEFVAADVQSVIVTLNEDYEGSTITGNFDLSIGNSQLFAGSLNLSPGVATDAIEIPSSSSSILSSITSGQVQVGFMGSTNEPLADDNFTLNLKFQIKATVE